MERYVPIRLGIEDHLLRGDLSLMEFGVYVTVHLQADYRTGIWMGSAPRLMATAPRGINLRDVQRALEHLEELHYLKSFRKHGQRGNTHYLIHKFTVRSGALTGMRLNALQSVCWERPVYEHCAVNGTDGGADTDAEGVAESAPYQEARSKEAKNNKKHPAPVVEKFDVFWNLYPKKVGKPPALTAWKKIRPTDFPAIFAGIEQWKASDQWLRDGGQYIPYPATFLNQERWKDLPNPVQQLESVHIPTAKELNHVEH